MQSFLENKPKITEIQVNIGEDFELPVKKTFKCKCVILFFIVNYVRCRDLQMLARISFVFAIFCERGTDIKLKVRLHAKDIYNLRIFNRLHAKDI